MPLNQFQNKREECDIIIIIFFFFPESVTHEILIRVTPIQTNNGMDLVNSTRKGKHSSSEWTHLVAHGTQVGNWVGVNLKGPYTGFYGPIRSHSKSV